MEVPGPLDPDTEVTSGGRGWDFEQKQVILLSERGALIGWLKREGLRLVYPCLCVIAFKYIWTDG